MINTNYNSSSIYNDKNNYISNNYNNKEECHTCENRKYKDGSDDAGVSFKNATKVSPNSASQAVHSHELEHVNRERSKAIREDKDVVSQTVSIKRSVCPECGTSYVSGGETKTVTREKIENLDDEARRGQFIDTYI